MDKETDPMLTEARIVEFENAAEASPEFVETVKAAAASEKVSMSVEDFKAWLAGL